MDKSKYDPLVRTDTTPAHHKLQPGDWYQFMANGTLIYADAPVEQPSELPVGTMISRPYKVGDILVWQFADEPGRRQFRILSIPVEGVYECSYISRC